MVAMRRLRLLLLPSQFSGCLCLIIALLICVVRAWSYIQHYQLFYEFLFGAYGFNTLLLEAPNSLYVISNAILNSTATYYVLLVMCGVLASLTTYAVLQAFGTARRATNEVIDELHQGTPAYKQAARESFLRLGLRVISVIGWTIYTIVFLSVLIPFSISILYNSIDLIQDTRWVGWIVAILSVLVITLCLHIHVVFARLVWLRPRLFGGDREIEEAEHHAPIE